MTGAGGAPRAPNARSVRSGSGIRSGWPAIVWLYLGPPIYRATSRSAEASLEGAVDAAILFRVAWWMVFGVVAAWGVYRERRFLYGLVRRGQGLTLVVGTYLLALLVSVVFSPARMFSLVNVVMMTVLVVAALDLALRLRAGRLTPTGLIHALHGATWLLLTVILSLLVLAPGVVATSAAGGLRLLGGEIGDPTMLASVAVVAGIVLASSTHTWKRHLHAMSVVVALGTLVITRGRTAYLALAVSLLAWFVLWLWRARPSSGLRGLGLAAAVATLLLIVGMVAQNTGGGAALETLGAYLTRDLEAVGSLSGRTGIFQILLRSVPEQPLGLGFAAGPRELLMASAGELGRYGVVASRIGNAHNAYFEMLAGAGVVGGVAFVLLLFVPLTTLAWRGVVGAAGGHRRSDLTGFVPVALLVMVHALTGSDAALPFAQASALLWILVGTTLAVSATIHASPPVAARRVRGGFGAGARGAAMSCAAFTCAVIAAALMGGPAIAQGAPEGAATPVVELHVAIEAPAASDRNPGTADAPLATLNEALERAVSLRREGSATRILVHPGTYRESLVGTYSDVPGPVITFEATEPGSAVVTGAERFDAWTCEAAVCTHEWPNDWSAERNPWPNDVQIGELALRRELVFVDGVNLEQVLQREALAPGAFFVDDRGGRLVLMPPVDVDMRTATVEVGIRPTLMRLQGLGNLVVRGLVFTAAASPFRQAAVDVVDQSNVTLEDVRVIWNGQVGLSLKGRDLTVRDALLDHNGSSGIAAYQVADVLISDTEASFNNWRGVRGDYDSWDVGHKFSSAHRVRLEDFRAFANDARGLWLDADIEDFVIERAYLCDNRRDGLFLEAIQGPVVVADSLICGNRAAGILTSASHDVELVGNVLRNNHAGQLVVSGQLERRILDWETGQETTVQSGSWLLLDNVLLGVDRQMLITSTLPTRVWNELLGSSVLAGNLYVQTDMRFAFEGPAGIPLDFLGWRSLSGEGATSTFSNDERDVP